MKYLLYPILTILLMILNQQIASSQSSSLNIIMIGAHPDDCDIKGGGTAALLSKLGHNVKFLSVTNGDAGHQVQGGGQLAKRRKAETQLSKQRLGIAEYEVLDNHDGELMPELSIRMEIIRRIRNWNADVVISHRPNDYHPDHRYTGVLVQDAAYMVGVPNVSSDTPPLGKNPLFLYFEDRFQKPNPFSPDIAIDISPVVDKKIAGLDAHVSQFYEWLPWISGHKGDIPQSNQGRRDWFKTGPWKGLFTPRSTDYLEKWNFNPSTYNDRVIEVFEICEYGIQPDEDELKAMFPMMITKISKE